MVGYSGTPLVKKLGIKEGFRIEVVNTPDNYFKGLIDLPDNVSIIPGEKDLDFVHIFSNQFEELERLLIHYKEKIVSNGIIWVSWYKKASKLPTEITEDVVSDIALLIGMVDVKVCAVDEIWSGLKVVIRVENRRK